MVSDVASSLYAYALDTFGGQGALVEEHVGGVAVEAEGEDGIVFHQQQLLLAVAILQLFYKPVLQLPRLAIGDAS